MTQTKEQNLLNAVTATTTSTPMNVEQFSRIGFEFTASGITTGNGVFTIEGTIDGINWVALAALLDNVAARTYVASKTLSANGSALVWVADIALKAIRAVVTRTTDGTYSVNAIALS